MFSEKEMREKMRAAPDTFSLHQLVQEWTP